MLVRTGSVTRSEPRRSLEDRDYLGMLLTDQRNMAAAWHGGGEPATVNRLPQPSLFLRGTKRKSPVKGLKVEGSFFVDGQAVQYRGVRIEDQYAHIRHGGQVQHVQ